ncbi:MAG: hypothetical protein PHD06_03315 [Bacteroidales bacterium]|nr:hypothetical protein [Bacteroidales bacterium]MDD4384188.1 hypothetical protein [Bacteroidales bacterium]MDY0196181.1 hypothetical protein [Tenuifilaceae bacterium]
MDSLVNLGFSNGLLSICHRANSLLSCVDANSIMQLIKVKETNNRIIGNLQENRKDLKKENQWIVDTMILDLKNIEDNSFWEEFNLCFRDVNQEFQEKISNQYPDLIHNERRLCALLYLDMTTKEIANITGQSIDSISLARTRLRNKVGLTSQNISINTFLKSL